MNYRKIRLASLSDVPSGCIKSFVVEGEGGVAIARAGERLYAFEDRCTHDDGELASGQVVEGGFQVECPRHGGRFDVASGRATRMPAIAPIKTYIVEVLEGDIFVQVPEVVHEA